jgi:diguanylate cyclase (GGDEF)-like protein
VSTGVPTVDAVPHVVVEHGTVVAVGPDLARELDADPAPLVGRSVESLGTRLDDAAFDELLDGSATIRLRLGPEVGDRPVRLRRLGADAGRTWIEVRSLADEFRLESLLRRSGYGHMLLTPDIELVWSLSSNELTSVFPGDNPLHWVELMDPDDMQTLGKAIHAVGADPSARRTVRHRLQADRTYTIVDVIESMIHDPDLRGVLVRSRFEDPAIDGDEGVHPFIGTTVSDHMPVGVVLASTAGKVLHRNAVAAELVGARDGQWVIPSGSEPWLLDGLGNDQRVEYRRVFDEAVAGRSGHCTVRSPFQADRWLRISIAPAAASTIVMVVEDTTELALAERAVRASNRLLEALDAHSEELVFVFDADQRARYVSSSVRRHVGDHVVIERLDDVVGYVHATDRSALADLGRRVATASGTSITAELRIDVQGTPGGRWHHVSMTNLLDDPDVAGLVLTLRDVHERHLMERELRFWATHDALTTLPDRAALRTQLDAVLAEADTLGRRTAVVFCDVDHFKETNDALGHHVGDQVLTEVAARLRASLRGSDVVGRFGGDEFVVVVPNVDDEEHAFALAERVFTTVSGPARVEGHDLAISVSMGVAITGPGCDTADVLVRRADEAMYRSKRAGRGRLTIYRDDGIGDGAAAAGGGGR